MSRSLGLLLLKAGLIQPAHLIEAHRSTTNGVPEEPLALRLVRLGIATEAQIAAALSFQLKLPRARLTIAAFEARAAARVPREVAEKYVVCPVAIEGHVLRLAMADPLNFDAICEVESVSGLPVRVNVATPTEIRAAIAAFYAVVETPIGPHLSDPHPVVATP